MTPPNALGFKGKKTISTESFDDVLVFVRFKQPEGTPRRALPLARRRALPGDAEPGSVMIKLFRNITRLELPTLLPEVTVVMSRKDALMLGIKCERGSHRFFKRYGEKFEDSEGKRVFLEFADEEREHLELLIREYRILTRKDKGKAGADA